MKRILATVLLLLASAVAWAVPTSEAVQAEVQRGNYVQAESMMREVVAAKPGSAKAHYILAEILAHNRQFDQAEKETVLAKQLDPALSFTQPEKFRAFEQLLAREKRTANQSTTGGGAMGPAQRTPMAAERSSGVPGWVWGAGFAVVAVLLWRMFSARRQAPPMGAGYAPTGGAYPAAGVPPGAYGAGYGPGPMGGGGSGMLGTGIAAAGGFAAGMLAEKLFDGNHERNSMGNGGSNNAGMFDDGSAGNPAADELAQRQVDFGTGNDWGGSSDLGGGDAGGGSSDDGW